MTGGTPRPTGFRVDIDDPTASARVAIVMFALIALLFATGVWEDYRAGELTFGYLEAGYLAILAYYAWRVAIHTGGGALPWRRPRYVAADEREVAWRIGGFVRTERRIPVAEIARVEVATEHIAIHLRAGPPRELPLDDLPYPARRAIREGFAALQ